MSEATFTMTIGAQSEAEINAAMSDHLRKRGYNVSEPNEKWETPSRFLARLGRCHNFGLSAAVKEWERRGGTVMLDCGPSGRIIELLSNPAFDEFCRKGTK